MLHCGSCIYLMATMLLVIIYWQISKSLKDFDPY